MTVPKGNKVKNALEKFESDVKSVGKEIKTGAVRAGHEAHKDAAEAGQALKKRFGRKSPKRVQQ